MGGTALAIPREMEFEPPSTGLLACAQNMKSINTTGVAVSRQLAVCQNFPPDTCSSLSSVFVLSCGVTQSKKTRAFCSYEIK